MEVNPDNLSAVWTPAGQRHTCSFDDFEVILPLDQLGREE